jgi:hypothetical protein
MQESSSLRRNFNVKEKILPIILVRNLTETGEGADMDDNVRNQKKSRRPGS